MKKLSKIRLINWHYLTNETIIVNNNVLLTGPNASGKSTIMDAIMFVITAGDTNFNMAANEKSKRDLKGYVKCKLGLDDKEYLREGDVTGHVALEFYDEKVEKYFTVGAVIDAFGDMMPVKTMFYKKEGQINDNDYVSNDGLIYSTVLFRKNHPDFEFFLTKKEAKRGFRNAFGSINEDFFKLIPKALAFKPISDVKEFIYQNVLEEKEIDVSAIKDTIRSYKELETTLNLIKNKITDLKEMSVIYKELETVIENRKYVEFLDKLFNKEKYNFEIESLTENIEKENLRKANIESDLRQLAREKDALNIRSKQLYLSLSNDEAFKAKEDINNEIQAKERLVAELEQDNIQFLKNVSEFKDTINNLKKKLDKKVFFDLGNLSLINLNKNEVEFSRLKLNEARNLVDKYRSDELQQLALLNKRKEEIVSEVSNIKEVLNNFNQKQVNYPRNLIMMKEEIAEGLKRIYNYEIPVFIFSELVEITDLKWQDTVEVFLGNRRFNLIIEPRYYDQALQIYNRIKEKYRLYGIGLVNTKKIGHFTKYEPNSLASIMTSENEDAKRYINMTCGNVIMCNNELELEKYNTAVTNDYLLYSGYTVRYMNPNIDKPFCGKNAYLAQQKSWETKAIEATKEYHEINQQISLCEQKIDELNSLEFTEIINGIDTALRLESEKDSLKGCYLQKEHLDTLSVKELQQDYDYVLETIKSTEKKQNALTLEIGKISQNIENLNDKILDLKKALNLEARQLENLSLENITLNERAQAEFKELTDSRTYQEAYNVFNIRYKNSDSSYETLETALLQKQFKYVNDYDSSFSTGISEMDSYFNELNKLEKSELVKYEQKVRSAREEAELIFKEDFIAKLRANIEQAEVEIGKINETLSNIHFGNDTYEFIFPKSSEYGEFYEMVTNNLEEPNKGLFTSNFEAKYETQIKELFDSLSVDEINSHGAINKFTDYRTYMDYDIKITNASGESMTYSKVFKEKSGGETQVPFYVAMIASFVRIYTKTNAFSGDPIGLVMFDEVFDKMDSNRMRAMMEFITSMPIQTIIACPPQRMSLLQDYANTVLIMCRKGTKANVMPILLEGSDK